MKQKNLILLVVAVGCGLLAAFLTTQMSAKAPTAEQSEMLVAAKELPVGTKIEKDKIAELIKKINQQAITQMENEGVKAKWYLGRLG